MSEQSQSTCKIRDFTEFLEKCLGRKVLEYTLEPLTKPGDNYGSMMLSVEVRVAEINDFNQVHVQCAFLYPVCADIIQHFIEFTD